MKFGRPLMSPHQRLPLALVAVVMLVACSRSGPAGEPSDRDPGDGDGGPQGDLRGGAVVRDGIEYAVDVAIMESFPVQLAGRVTITNRSDTERTVTFPDGCVALMRAYRGSELVWDQSEDFACTMVLVQMTLEPGGSRTVDTGTVSANQILDDELPDGTYRIAVYLRPDGVEVEVSAGEVDLAIPR